MTILDPNRRRVYQRLENDDEVREALVTLYELQTPAERGGRIGPTPVNQQGFSMFDAEYGQALAWRVMNGDPLREEELDLARMMVRKYWRQLV